MLCRQTTIEQGIWLDEAQGITILKGSIGKDHLLISCPPIVTPRDIKVF